MKRIFIKAIIIGTAVCMMAGCSNLKKQQETQPERKVQDNYRGADNGKPSGNAISGNGAGSSASSDSAEGNIISEEQAKQIALADAKVPEADITGITVRLEMDDYVQNYEVKFYTANQEYDYDIDAKNGTIRKKDSDINDHAARTDKNELGGEVISEQDAKALALAKVPEATETDLQIYQEMDDGREVYKGTIVFNGTKYEFEMDAATGTFTEWEEESVLTD